MKNILIYISPTHSFNNPRQDLTSNDAEVLAKIQIENSLGLGWKKEDILLITNFEFRYGEFAATVLKDIEFFERKPQATKINAILKMFELKIVKKNELYWFHDLDAFQLEQFKADEIKLKNNEIAVTDFSGGKKFAGKDRLSGGVIFFKSEAEDIFLGIKKIMYSKHIDEEEALGLLVQQNEQIQKRVKKLNSSYNFIGFKLKSAYAKAIKPLRVAHFHPLADIKGLKIKYALNFFMGENEIHTPLITQQLIKLFKFHRIRPAITVAIIIPTYKRAKRLLRVYKNAKQSSPLITNVYFVVEKDDTESIAVLTKNKLPYFLNIRTKNYAGALNTAYLSTTERYFFHGADDLEFTPGWLEKCLAKMIDEIKVVGTNDLLNKQVLQGIHSTHNLIDREYIQKKSGVFDEKNLVFSESYFHNWIDTELVEFAKLRGAFSPCLEAIVKHLHWTNNLSKKDKTYDLQEHTYGRDRRNFVRRRSLWTKNINRYK